MTEYFTPVPTGTKGAVHHHGQSYVLNRDLAEDLLKRLLEGGVPDRDELRTNIDNLNGLVKRLDDNVTATSDKITELTDAEDYDGGLDELHTEIEQVSSAWSDLQDALYKVKKTIGMEEEP